MEQRAFSKINVGLAITDKRDDGYHNIDTIFQSIFLGDSLYFARHHSVVFSGDAPELPYYMAQLIPYTESNIAMKALRMVQNYSFVETSSPLCWHGRWQWRRRRYATRS